MTVVAFDAKEFQRGKPDRILKGGVSTNEFLGFHTQLGVGVEFRNEKQFVESYLAKSKSLQTSFGINLAVPFASSTELRRTLTDERARAFVDQLITDVQGFIQRVHFSYVVLPRHTVDEISVGGNMCPIKQIPRTQFLNNLGPVFSYLTAYTYLWFDRFNATGKEFHIDAFISKETMAWQALTKATSPKIYFKGDECNPFINCADLLAYMTDVKLFNRRLKLEPHDLRYA